MFRILLICIISLFLFTPAHAQPVAVITSPSPFQVFQRITNNTGAIVIQGTYESTGIYDVTGSWGDFHDVLLYSGVSAHFVAYWPDLPVWQHDLILTIDGTEYTVPNVGIGDVYIVAGQSNAVGYGRHLQMYLSTLGLRGVMFRSDGWQELADPTHNDTAVNANGSEWPLLATYILEYGVPVAFVPVAVGSSYISQWQPGKPNFQRMTALIDQLPMPYAKAVLWQQGEADTNIVPRTYADRLLIMSAWLYKYYKIPVFAAKLYHNANVNTGVTLAINESGGYVLQGADLHDLERDKPPHYVSDENLQIEAWHWFIALAAYYP